MGKFKSISPIGHIILVAGLIYSLLSVNPLHTFLAVVLPFILVKLSWKNDEAPILFTALMTQYMAISVKVFYANYSNLAFDDISLHRYPDYINEAYYWGMGGLVTLALGIHFAIRGFKHTNNTSILAASHQFNGDKLGKLYLLLAIAYPILFKLSFSIGGLQQPLSKLIEFKWALFFIFMIYAFYKNEKKMFLWIASAELLFSFTGFFSGFKDYFLILFIGMVVLYGQNFKLQNIIPLGVILIVGFYTLMIWQYVKPAYREFLNAGQKTQTSVRSTEESLFKLYNLVTEIDSTGIKEGFEATVNRLSYIEFLSGAIEHVPYQLEHTNGELWLGAVERVLKPRILFPEKAAIDDSEKARLYTGQDYSGVESGTSISLGYFAESYVDFGKTGMLLILLVFGFVIGSIYRYILKQSPDLLIGTALTIPLFFVIFNYERALDKIFGALFMYLIIYLAFNRLVIKKTIEYLKND
ncbi:hypothetical protein FYC62_00540 [Pedobacter aquae]|uniref:O-antigen polysaccharide polymerase Wzy n=1 Tax=Pedobacter aquae TaxID=2605747 RepID=A0A5C0VE33_9SPHI|nr:hypothetical protein [Pedobacter aquae]QEK50319.1 hypothetical protein FYC62_00540 [Pedobacter aquae]